MPTGVIINSFSIILGGLAGGLLGHQLSDQLKYQLNLILGLCSMGMGIAAIGLMNYLPAVILSLILGTLIGLVLRFGDWINKAGNRLAKIFPIPDTNSSQDECFLRLGDRRRPGRRRLLRLDHLGARLPRRAARGQPLQLPAGGRPRRRPRDRGLRGRSVAAGRGGLARGTPVAAD